MMNSTRKKNDAFTIVELLVVIAVLAVLLSLLVPSLVAAKIQARAIVCRTNLHQLALASICYAGQNDEYYVPAAEDLWNGLGGYKRWHGIRETFDEPFEPMKGPLVGYLDDGRVKKCPEPVGFSDENNWTANFENGCGGYGYNMTYLGSTIWDPLQTDFVRMYEQTARTTQVRQPAFTLMFADTAFSNSNNDLIEYSFAEPPFLVFAGVTNTEVAMLPSIHFRHDGSANIAWADGHIDSKPVAPQEKLNAYNVLSADMMLGWFEPLDNSLFDLD